MATVILTDPQVAILRRTVGNMTTAYREGEHYDEDWSVNGPDEADIENLEGALEALHGADRGPDPFKED